MASFLGVEFAEVAAAERGVRVFQFDLVAALLDLYGVFDRVEREHLLGLARVGFRLPRWQDDFAGPVLDVSMVDVLWLESIARRVRCYSPVLVPELLRTPEYVEAVVRQQIEDVSDTQLGWWMQAYRDRRQALDASPVTEVQAVIAESVLRRPVGGRAGVLRGQLEHLAEAAGGERFEVRVVRAEGGYVAGMDGGFTVFELREPYPRWVAATGDLSGVAVHEGQVAERYAVLFDRLWQAAVGAEESVALIGPPAQ